MGRKQLDSWHAAGLVPLCMDPQWIAQHCFYGQWPWLCCHTPLSWLSASLFWQNPAWNFQHFQAIAWEAVSRAQSRWLRTLCMDIPWMAEGFCSNGMPSLCRRSFDVCSERPLLVSCCRVPSGEGIGQWGANSWIADMQQASHHFVWTPSG